MRAVCWNGKGDVRVETVPDPRILNPRDAIVKVHGNLHSHGNGSPGESA